jgi:hypothetical protein
MRTGKIERLSLEQWGHLFSIVGVLIGLVSIASVMTHSRSTIRSRGPRMPRSSSS